MAGLPTPLTIFLSYAHEDERLRNEIEKHLSLYRRKRYITIWFDRRIQSGQDWEKEINTKIYKADIILLLISADFLSSDYCYGTEMQIALERHEVGTAYVIPIIIRPVNWSEAPFSHLQVLPTDGQPIESSYWHNRDEALTDIARGVDKIVKILYTQKPNRGLLSPKDLSLHLTSEVAQRQQTGDSSQISTTSSSQKISSELVDKGDTLQKRNRYQAALLAYEEAIIHDYNNGHAYNDKGICLCNLRRYDEALIAFNQAISLKPNSAAVYSNRAHNFVYLKRYKKALADYDSAIRINPNLAYVYENKGDLLLKCKRHAEAATTYDYAISLTPNNFILFRKKALALWFSGNPVKSFASYSLYIWKRSRHYIEYRIK